MAAAADYSVSYPAEQKEKNLKRYHLFQLYAENMSTEAEPAAGQTDTGRLERNMRLYEKKLGQLSEEAPIYFSADPVPTPAVDPKNLERVVLFLEQNISDTRMPLSYRASVDYWRSLDEGLGKVETVLERALVQNSLNIYDGALWQMALMIAAPDRDRALVDSHTQRLLSGEAGDIQALRGYGPSFYYGDEETMMDSQTGYFFRMISDHYLQDDPLGENDVPGFPNFSRVHHEDWKPVTGEQAWAVIIGPLQVAAKKYGAGIPMDCPEIKLALSILPALHAMQSPAGAFYHAPKGTYGIHPKLISNENNFSVYAALNMLEPVLRKNDPADADLVKAMKDKLEIFFEKNAYDRQAHQFYVGGYYVDEQMVSGKLMASDCQTWAIAALGPRWIDDHFGEGESYAIWKNMIAVSGHADPGGALDGIGFNSDHAVVSVEWTCGAILAARLTADFYRRTHPEWSKILWGQAALMRQGIEKYQQELPGGQTAYLYVSQRYFIPFGWWASPIPSLSSSAWILFTDMNFNPFKLGGAMSSPNDLIGDHA